MEYSTMELVQPNVMNELIADFERKRRQENEEKK